MLRTRVDPLGELVAKLSCPYDPDVPIQHDTEREWLNCPACGRRYPWNGRCYDLRTDDLRAGTSKWRPGEPGWTDGVLGLFGGTSRPRPDPPTPPGQEILDIGSGARPAGSFNLDAYVPEPMPPNFVLGTADRLPYLAKSFDSVVTRYVIEHVTDPPKFIRDCVRLARDSVTIVTDNPDWIGQTAFRFLGRGRIFHPEHVYAWSLEYLRNLLERLDFPDAHVYVATLSDTPIVKLVASVGRGKILGPLLHRDLVARIVLRGAGDPPVTIV